MVGELKTYEAEGNEDIWKIPHDLQPDFSAELLQKNIRFT